MKIKTRIFKLISIFLLFSFHGIGISGAYFSDSAILEGITITAGCWAKPNTPTLVYPSNGYVANSGSDWLTNPYIDWSDSWVCPDKTVSYEYESYHDLGLTNLAYRSDPLLTNSTIPAHGTPDGVYYWRVRAFDGTNYSEWSDTWLLTVNRTLPPATPFQAVVINEIMWMGSTFSPADEWIELRNTTASPIVLTGWKIENAGESGDLITLNGTIPAGGFFLLSNYTSNASAIKDTIIADQVTAYLSLLDGAGEQLTLKDSLNVTIDQTPLNWSAGVDDTIDKKSMERNDDPVTGWHTCMADTCHSTIYWDLDGNNLGTPKATNLSENDPSETNLDLYTSADKRNVTIRVYGYGISQFDTADYLLTYDSDQGIQGATGTIKIGEKNDVSEFLPLGSYSTGGTFIPNTGVKTIKVEVILKGLIERKLDKEIIL